MFAAAICVSILLGVLVWALPGRLCDRRATHADVLAGPGIVLAVWIIAACVFAQPGLAQGFDLFRLLAINGAALWACGTVLLLRLRNGRRYRTLWTVAALLIAAIGLPVMGFIAVALAGTARPLTCAPICRMPRRMGSRLL